jgi:type VI secretion system secreted protein Hcp
MAETVHLFLKAQGVDIKGESTQTSLGRQDSIECVYFDHSVDITKAPASAQSAGKKTYAPIIIRKRIDKSSPLLFKALTTNQVIDAVFKFYRPKATGDGTTEQFYTISIKQGQVVSIRDYVADTLTPETSTLPALEEVGIIFKSISWNYTNGGITAEDNWNTVRQHS